MKLNPSQHKAVQHREGPVLVLAGAGSGKTRVITHRIARLIEEGAHPASILAVSFTNKSAAEMRERMAPLVGKDTASKLLLSTFHSFGVRFLSVERDYPDARERFVIFDQSDSMGLIKDLLRRSGSEAFRKFDASAIQTRISLWKNAGLLPVQAPDDFEYDEAAKEVFERYETALRSMHAVDFDDLVIKPAHILRDHAHIRAKWQSQVKHILIDEFQDTNAIQFQLVTHLAKNDGDVCVVGDDDQSIYGWRGADIRNIRAFQEHFKNATTIPLEDNYRSYGPILDVANSAIALCKERAYPKVLRAVRGTGDAVRVCICEDAELESQWIAEEIRALHKKGIKPNDIAVLYRSNLLARTIEQELRSGGIPYRMYGGTQLFDRKEVKDVIAYMRVVVHPRDEISLRRIINTPARGIGESTLARLETYAATHNISFNEAFVRSSTVVDLPEGARHGLAILNGAIDDSRTALRRGQSPSAVAKQLLERVSMLERQSSDTEKEHKRRRENIDYFLRSLERFEAKDQGQSLSQFLTQATLRADQDEEKGQGVTLSTLHAAKGLEFCVVFLMGCVEGQLPHSRTTDPKISDATTTDIEEERRLFYVGVTRARDKLYLTYPKRKMMRGKAIPLTPTRFLENLPEASIERYEPSRPEELEPEDMAAMSRAILEQLSAK